jgi:hypothetical protein
MPYEAENGQTMVNPLHDGVSEGRRRHVIDAFNCGGVWAGLV